MIRREDVYQIGKIGKPHGISGEVNLAFDDDVFDRTDAEYLILDMDGILVPFFMEEYRFRSDTTAIVHFSDINTQEQARELTGRDVYFPRAKAEDGEATISWRALVGYFVIDCASGRDVGRIQAIDDSTINLLFDVITPEGRSLLLPAHEELIVGVDTKRQTLIMDLPYGLEDM